MNKLYYITDNQSKFLTAQNILQKHDIDLEQMALEIAEIQAATTKEVAQDKAVRAFELVKKPLLVSDHGWLVDTLKGFPGPYMRYINNWFGPEDFLALMEHHTDREVILRQDLIYIDEKTTKSFSYDLKGYILREAKGELGTNWDKVVCLTKDGKSIAETREQSGKRSILLDEPEPWPSFAQWYWKYLVKGDKTKLVSRPPAKIKISR